MSSGTTEIAIQESGLTVIESREAVGELARAEVDVQISTAKRWPRNLTDAKREALELATLDEATASTMFYVLPRSGKKIEGPSIRLAEVIASSWGNLRYGARIIEVDKKNGFVTAQGFAHDLQKNTAATDEIRRRITDKQGRTYNDDMIQVTCRAAAKIAQRNAIFSVIPRALVDGLCREAKLAAIGDVKTMAAKRADCMEWFRKAGADDEQVFAFLDVKSEDDIGVDELITLKGLATSIKDGEISIDAAFAVDTDNGARASRSPANEALKGKQAPKESEHEPEPKAEEPTTDHPSPKSWREDTVENHKKGIGQKNASRLAAHDPPVTTLGELYDGVKGDDEKPFGLAVPDVSRIVQYLEGVRMEAETE